MKLIQVIILWLKVYALAITIKGRDDCMACVSCELTKANMQLSQLRAIAEKRRLEREMEMLRNPTTAWWAL